ncbi:MAG: hypothetical protein WB723_16235 [Candidatus Acidiferrales bacterium]
MPDENAPETPSQPQAPATTPAAAPAAAPPVAATSSTETPAAPVAKAPATPPAAAAKPPATSASATAAPASTAAAPAATAVATEPEAPAPPKVKPKKATQRACDEKDAKGKLCCGHLKRWYDYPKEIEVLVGKQAEIYRCEFCQTIYKPDRSKTPHSYTLRY